MRRESEVELLRYYLGFGSLAGPQVGWKTRFGQLTGKENK